MPAFGALKRRTDTDYVSDMSDQALLLEGGTYTVSAAHDGEGLQAWDGAPAATFALRELNGKLYATVDTGCNGLTIPIRLDPTHITLTDGVAMTGKWCPGPRGEQEHWLLNFFAGQIKWALSGQTLQLNVGDKVLQLQRDPEPRSSN